jgi:hypothetical protein
MGPGALQGKGGHDGQVQLGVRRDTPVKGVRDTASLAQSQLKRKHDPVSHRLKDVIDAIFDVVVYARGFSGHFDSLSVINY